jgi:hypothetical protein
MLTQQVTFPGGTAVQPRQTLVMQFRRFVFADADERRWVEFAPESERGPRTIEEGKGGEGAE